MRAGLTSQSMKTRYLIVAAAITAVVILFAAVVWFGMAFR